jgi:cell division septal protein FtsQ
MSEKSELSRADLVRIRRERENAQHMKRAALEAARPVPQVTTRADSEMTRPRKRSTSRGRRRFQVALPLPGTDVRTISMPRPRWGWRSLSLTFATSLGLLIYLAFQRPELRVVQAEITGNRLLAPSELNSVLNVAGQPIFVLIPEDLETRLRLHYPELVSVNVDVSMPNHVSVNIVERQPVIRWEQGGGYTWIAEDGIAFRPRGEVLGLISVVALSGPAIETVSVDPLTPAPFISTEMVESLKGLAAHVPPAELILYDSILGFGWNDPRGWRVYFGTSANDVELKMQVYESMIASLTQRGIRPALINVTYPTAPYYRMSQ